MDSAEESIKTTVTETGDWGRDLEVEVAASRIDVEVDRATRRHRKRLELPGFRKGKVPLQVVVRRYGDAIRQDVINDLLPTLMHEATRSAGLMPAAPPTITKLEHEPGQPLSFTASVDIWPEIEVENYEKLKVTQVVHEVTDAEIDEQLADLQNRQSTERSVERGLQKGDVLIADLQRTDGAGVPIVGEKFEERYFLIGGDDAPSPEFEEAVVGMSAGDERQVTFSYRQDLPNEELAGTQDSFLVTVREVRERNLPELDDEFAKDVGDQFQSLEELRQHVTGQLDSRWKYLGRQRIRAELMEGLIRENPFDLPDSLVDGYLENMRREREEARKRQGAFADSPAAVGPENEENEEEERADAVRRLRSYLLLEGLRKKVDVEVSDEDFGASLSTRAETIGTTAEELKASPRAAEMRRELEEDKIFDYLTERAEMQEEKV